MNAVDLLAEVSRAGIHLTRRGDKLHVSAPRGTVTPALRERLTQAKPELLRLLPDPNARPVLHFRLPGYGIRAWATAMGRPGESMDSLRADLVDRWPDVEVKA